jgi:hypothetical protein
MLNSVLHPVTEWQVTRAKSNHRKAEPKCACCGHEAGFFGATNDVHHVIPVHIAPDKAADDSNLMTMCRLCHFTFGHLGDWKAYNTRIEDTVELVQSIIATAKAEWKAK